MLISPGTDYPDLLGVISKQRLSLDVADVAFGLRPSVSIPNVDHSVSVDHIQISAGQRFDGVLLVQNNADCNIDAEARLVVPGKDSKGGSRRFLTKADKRIAVGLTPGEVGYIRFPVTVDPQTAPADVYTLQVEVEIKRTIRTAARVRKATGTMFKLEDLPQQMRNPVAALSTLTFTPISSRQGRNGALLTQTFSVLPPIKGAAILTGNTAELTKVEWVSVWTPRDMMGNQLSERARMLTAMAQTQMRRENIFIPLVRATQRQFSQAGYRLWAGEAIVIAKLLTLLLEGSMTPTAAIRATNDQPRWFSQMARLLLDTPDMVKEVGKMAAEPLYLDLIYDATFTAFNLLRSVTTEDLGSVTEQAEYAELLVRLLGDNGIGANSGVTEEVMDISHAYLPLVLGGLIAAHELVMPGEQALDSIELMVNARISREKERTESNQFIFNLLDKVLDNVLTRHDTSLQRYLDPLERLRLKQQ